MDIAIVEDLEQDYFLLHDMLLPCLGERRIECSISHFKDGESFLSSYRPDKFQLIFLDILLGDGLTGMQTAQNLRKTDPDTPIVFITGERDYALIGYEVRAMDYLVKPYSADRITSVVERVLQSGKVKHHLMVQSGHEQRRICIDDLMWANAQDHCLELHLSCKETLRTYAGFEKFVEGLPKQQRFQYCCRGVVVNLDFVIEIKGGDFILSDGTCVPVSRAKRSEMKRAFADYAIYQTRG